MKCPNCNHVSEKTLFQCASCGMTFERSTLETLHHLEYLRNWLDEHAAELGVQAHARLQADVQSQIESNRKILFPTETVPTHAPETIRPASERLLEILFGQAMLEQVADWLQAGAIGSDSADNLRQILIARIEKAKLELAGERVPIEPPSELQVIELALEAIPDWTRAGYLYESAWLRNYLNEKRDALARPTPVAVPQPPAPEPGIVSAPTSQPVPARPGLKPPPPPQPAAPPIDWGKLWARAIDLAMSGALLRGLLYLGAFMIVVSAIVLVVVYWSFFPFIIQLGIVAALPLSFYLAGIVLRKWLTIPVAGSVFIGIGALLVAVDFAAVYQLGGLAKLVDLNAYWLIASLICALVYALTAWQMRGEFFGYITLIAASSGVFALTQLLRLPLEWGFTALTITGAGMIESAARARVSDQWNDLVRATRRLPILLLPIAQILVLFVPGNASLGQTTTWLIASFGFGLMTFRFPNPIFIVAAVGSSLVAVWFGTIAIHLPWEWYATTAAVFSPIYIFGGRWVEHHLPNDLKSRRMYFDVFFVAGFGLVALGALIAVLTLIANWWAGIIALTVISFVLVCCAYLFRNPVFALFASGLFIAPFSLAIGRWLYDARVSELGAWMTTGWAGLALVYLGIAAALRQLERYVRWLNLCAHLLAPFAVLVLLVNYLATFRNWVAIPTLAGLSGIIIVYLVSAFIHDSDKHPALSRFVSWLPTKIARAIFLWFPGLLIPFWLSALWVALPLHREWLGVGIAALALAYVGIGELLARRKSEYRLPPHLYAYPLALVGIFASLANPWALLIALSLVVAVLLALSFVYRRLFETALTVLIFSIAFAQLLAVIHLVPGYDAVAWVALAYAYVLLERGVVRAQAKTWVVKYRLPLQVGALGVWILGLALTYFGTIFAFAGRRVDDYIPLILAQSFATGLTVLTARLYRNRLPLALEPWLGFFPVTLGFIGYGAQIFGTALTTPQYAMVWIAYGTIQLVAGALLDRAAIRYAHGLYVGGYALSALALLWSAPDRAINLVVLGASILIALGSQILIHRGRHIAFDDFVNWMWRTPGTTARRGASTAFLFFAAYAFPVWLIQLLMQLNVALAWQGFALAVVAPLYIAIGLLLRRFKTEYTWSVYSVAYILTALGAMIAFDNELIAIYVLALDAVVYAVSAYIFRQAFWLYLSNVLAPIIALIALHYRNDLQSNWVTTIFMGLAFVYFGIGQMFDRTKTSQGVSPFALPFYAPGYLLSALALAVASGDKMLALYTYPVGVILYALSARVFREAMFLYPAAWLVAVPYLIAMTLTALPAQWYGVGWLPLIVGYIVFGKFVFHRTPIRVKITTPSTIIAALTQPAMPFYLLAYALSVHMIALSPSLALTLTVASVSAAILYFASAALFRRVGWLYPGLLVAHLALAASTALVPSDKPAYYIAIPFLGLTWIIALVGYVFSRRFDSARGNQSLLQRLVTWSWSQPFFAIAALDVIVWQIVALPGSETAIILGIGNAILLGLFTFLWQDRILAYGALGFGLLAVVEQLIQFPLAIPEKIACLGGIGLGLSFVARIAEWISSKQNVFAVWIKPLTHTAIFLTAFAVVATAPTITTHATMTAASLAFAGALYLAMAYRGKYQRLGYLGVAMLELAWALVLIMQDVRQPQLYAIPAGLYFSAVGYLERRRARGIYAMLIEILGLAVLLLTSFIQSLNGNAGLPYFLLLMVEALLVIWWGAARRIKIPFFIGLGASALNVIAQVAVLVNVYDINRFFVIFGVGLLLVIAAVFVERQRARIIARAQEWRETLETWE